jgi:hypothetical protein
VNHREAEAPIDLQLISHFFSAMHWLRKTTVQFLVGGSLLDDEAVSGDAVELSPSSFLAGDDFMKPFGP